MSAAWSATVAALADPEGTARAVVERLAPVPDEQVHRHRLALHPSEVAARRADVAERRAARAAARRAARAAGGRLEDRSEHARDRPLLGA